MLMALPATLPLLPIDITSISNENLEESDEELFMVPNMEEGGEEEKEKLKSEEGSLQSSSNNNNNNNNNNDNNNNNNNNGSGGELPPPKRKRGRNPIDKEYRRLKRLLRNRVSAQQARERKKVYVNDLETRAKELEEMNFKLESKISTLVNENTMLRKVLMNTRPKTDESEDPKCA